MNNFRLKFYILTGLFLIIFPIKIFSHEIRPAYLEIWEDSTHNITVFWKQPIAGETAVKLIPVLSSGWLKDSVSNNSVSYSALIRKWNIKTIESIEGQTITIEGLENTITDVLVNITFADGTKVSRVLKPVEPFLTISKTQTDSIPVWGYLRLGIDHILGGFDHLLFVLGLMLLVKGKMRLIKTITAFTIAHSITLAAATLGWVNVSSAPVEAVIALSIIFLAVELVHLYQGKEVFSSKYPWVVAFVFGLLHGFGFAGALTSIGLPQNDIPLTLFLFNAGVEIGQLIFVFSILGIMFILKKVFSKLPEWTRWIPPYAIGSLAAFWFIERMKIMFFN